MPSKSETRTNHREGPTFTAPGTMPDRHQRNAVLGWIGRPEDATASWTGRCSGVRLIPATLGIPRAPNNLDLLAGPSNGVVSLMPRIMRGLFSYHRINSTTTLGEINRW